jgi:hypothetical protein
MKKHLSFIHFSGVTQTFEYKLPGKVYEQAQRLIPDISKREEKKNKDNYKKNSPILGTKRSEK